MQLSLTLSVIPMYLQITVFSAVTPCSLVHGYQCYRETCCLHFQGQSRQGTDAIREKINEQKGRKDEIKPGLDSKGSQNPVSETKILQQSIKGYEYGKVKSEKKDKHNQEQQTGICQLSIRLHSITIPVTPLGTIA